VQFAVNRRLLLAQGTPDPKHRLASPISAPELLALRTSDYFGTPKSHAEHLES
jgi:hypothetical protein